MFNENPTHISPPAKQEGNEGREKKESGNIMSVISEALRNAAKTDNERVFVEQNIKHHENWLRDWQSFIAKYYDKEIEPKPSFLQAMEHWQWNNQPNFTAIARDPRTQEIIVNIPIIESSTKRLNETISPNDNFQITAEFQERTMRELGALEMGESIDQLVTKMKIEKLQTEETKPLVPKLKRVYIESPPQIDYISTAIDGLELKVSLAADFRFVSGRINLDKFEDLLGRKRENKLSTTS